MRIVHVTHELPPYESAGTAIYTYNIAKAQAEEHEVFVFARLQDPEVEPYRIHNEQRDGLQIRFMNLADLEWSPFKASYNDPESEHHLRVFLEEVEPDIIHFQHILGFGQGAVSVAKSLGVPVVFTLHDFWSMCPMGQRMCYTDEVICDPIDFGKCGPCVFGAGWKEVGTRETAALEAHGAGKVAEDSKFQRLYAQRYMETPGRFARKPRAFLWAAKGVTKDALAGNAKAEDPIRTTNPFEYRFLSLRNALAACDLLITPSAFLRDEFMTHYGFTPQQIIHSANGMDFSYVKTLPKTPAKRLRFGFVGSIIRTKGVHVLVEGFLKTAEQFDDIELHVHGAPNRWSKDYLAGLEAKAKDHPAGDRVTFHGRFDNRRIGEILADIDVLVVPSIWFENAPLTLNEAAMTRTPIIVSDRGGMLEFAKANAYGRTFELGNAASLADVMQELCEDRSKIQELSGNAPPIKPVSANAHELIEVYGELIAGRYRAPSLEEQTQTRGGCVTKS